MLIMTSARALSRRIVGNVGRKRLRECRTEEVDGVEATVQGRG